MSPEQERMATARPETIVTQRSCAVSPEQERRATAWPKAMAAPGAALLGLRTGGAQ
jgi:valyl-tRNA synthetase